MKWISLFISEQIWFDFHHFISDLYHSNVMNVLTRIKLAVSNLVTFWVYRVAPQKTE